MPHDGSQGDATPFFISFRLPALTSLDVKLNNDYSWKLRDCANVDHNWLLEKLQFSDSDPQPLVPMLTALRMTGVVYSFSFTDAALERMIRSRWWSDEQLSALTVPPRVARLKCVWVPLTGSGLAERIQDCRDEGLHWGVPLLNPIPSLDFIECVVVALIFFVLFLVVEHLQKLEEISLEQNETIQVERDLIRDQEKNEFKANAIQAQYKRRVDYEGKRREAGGEAAGRIYMGNQTEWRNDRKT
ncbi:hypothetical protein C8J57DRAFT_1461450 [Mycena rebaudengoi]|nr:hypothetical protein C8J57DRAFT_1461450 [Mycena rebaudengoi]